ncbi:hypothetical protein TNCV_273091 [Trichonephila clavipes]|nr:hypothetical protein TNCV_273091 [Trichonephila clavipes]
MSCKYLSLHPASSLACPFDFIEHERPLILEIVRSHHKKEGAQTLVHLKEKNGLLAPHNISGASIRPTNLKFSRHVPFIEWRSSPNDGKSTPKEMLRGVKGHRRQKNPVFELLDPHA